MNRLIQRLVEEGPPDIDIGPYLGPVEFTRDVRDILDHALFLKRQAEQAGALSPGIIGDVPGSVVNRAMLRLAVEELDNETMVDRTIKRLNRVMHSIW